jgi:hypothetical protein
MLISVFEFIIVALFFGGLSWSFDFSLNACSRGRE